MNGRSKLPSKKPYMQPDLVNYLPAELASIAPQEIKSLFPNPTLIVLEGERDETLFISTLLHGNETTSFEVLQYLEQRYRNAAPSRNLMIFIGNVDATAAGERYLHHQQDFNRIWAHTGPHDASEYHALAQSVIEIARHSNLFASIDIHNNTGNNPHYGCVNTLRPADLQLASLFGPLSVFYRNPSTTQSIAFAELCPAITLECGQSGDVDGRDAAIALIEKVLALDAFTTKPPEEPVRLFETIGRVVIDPECAISFDGSAAELSLTPELETSNFIQMQAGHVWGKSQRAHSPMRVLDEHGQDLTGEFFRYDDGVIALNCNSTPSMITFSLDAIRQDCLCYLMRTIEG
ncbi:MAG: M14 family metallopeptidase [Pseudomonadota bacterium]